MHVAVETHWTNATALPAFSRQLTSPATGIQRGYADATIVADHPQRQALYIAILRRVGNRTLRFCGRSQFSSASHTAGTSLRHPLRR